MSNAASPPQHGLLLLSAAPVNAIDSIPIFPASALGEEEAAEAAARTAELAEVLNSLAAATVDVVCSISSSKLLKTSSKSMSEMGLLLPEAGEDSDDRAVAR